MLRCAACELPGSHFFALETTQNRLGLEASVPARQHGPQDGARWA